MIVPVAREVDISLCKIYVGRGQSSGRKSIQDLIKNVRLKSLPFLGARPAKKDTLAYLVFSSGTSGLPKGKTYSISCQFIRLNSLLAAVMISHGNILYSLGQAAVMGAVTQQVYKVRIMSLCLN